MSDVVLGALITAVGAIFVALIALVQHRTGERAKAQRLETEERLEHSEELFGEYRHLLVELRTELERERAERERERVDAERVRGERDKWRARAVTAERQVEQWILERRKGES